jgi:hypothetical protein
MVPAGPVYRLATLGPVRWLGRISYGVYLFHWPALVFVQWQRPGQEFRLALVIVGVLGVAAVSERWYERPIRRNVPPLTRLVPWLAPVAALLLVFGPLALSPSVDRSRDVLDGLDPQQLVAARSAPGKNSVPTVASFGDSGLLSLLMATGHWNRNRQYFRQVGGVVKLGCGIVRGGLVQAPGAAVPIRAECDAWPTTWPKVVSTKQPDFAVVMSCQWETIDRLYPSGGRWQHLGDSAFDALVRREYLAAADALLKAGAPLVVWVTCPHFSQRVGTKKLPAHSLESRDPARVDRLNEIVREVAAERPDRIRVLEWGQWVDQRIDDARLRPDGSHFEWKKDTGVGKEWGRRLLATWRDWLVASR